MSEAVKTEPSSIKFQSSSNIQEVEQILIPQVEIKTEFV